MNDEDDTELVAQHHVASRLAARAEIQDVRLLRTRAEVDRFPEPDRRLTYDLEFDSNVDWDPDETAWFVIRIESALRIYYADDEETDDPDADEAKDSVATAEFEHAALFSCRMRDDDGPLTEDELIAYGATTAQFLLYPFIREYIHDTTGRLALPPLTIGVLARPLPQ